MIGGSQVQFSVGAAVFFFQGLNFCVDSGIRSTLVLSQQHIKDPGHSAKSAGGRLQQNTHPPYRAL